MKYKEGFKYQLYKNEIFQTNIRPKKTIKTEYITLTSKGLLIIEKGYAWDGASGPAIDTKSIMCGSLAHDALFQLLRMKLLPQAWRRDADRELIKIMEEDARIDDLDSPWWVKAFNLPRKAARKTRRFYVSQALKYFGASSADPKNAKKVLTAP